MSNKKLVDLLVQKTNLDKTQVQQQLRQLIEKVRAEVEKNGTFKVQGLGEFSQVDGSLFFKAEEDLATEINHKYAGMKPLELIGAYKDTSGEKEQEAKETEETEDTGSVFGIEEYQEDTEQEEEPIEEIVTGEDEDPITEEPEAETEETFPEFEGEDGTPSFELDEEVAEREEHEEQLQPEHESEPKAQPEPVESEPAGLHQQKTAPAEQSEESKDPIGKMLVVAVVVIALGVSGWLVYDMGFFGNGQSNSGRSGLESRSPQNVNVAQNDIPEQTGTDKSATDAAVSDSVAQNGSQDKSTSEQNAQKPISNETSIAEESRQSIYGLRGGAAPRASDGYTIVVHSMRNEVRIRRENEKLQKEGYRTIISSANVMDTTYWRLGLGQFKTITDATEAASTLPDPYRSNHFIKRIQ